MQYQEKKVGTPLGTRLLRLSLFFFACLVLGFGTLFALFAPNINPSLTTDVVFQRDPLQEAKSPFTFGRIPNDLIKLDAAYNHPFNDQDFQQVRYHQTRRCDLQYQRRRSVARMVFQHARSAEYSIA
jgi:hypothetical protein